MLIPNSNLTKDEAQWLLRDYKPMMNNRIDHSTIKYHLRAFNSIKGTNQSVPSCSCQWVQASKVSQSLFDQYKTEIEAIANA